ncbi:MAG: AAA family ATPase [Phaeodactylibacter sp.]|nr:AAA family ATPase [Phaeodactylibacter sp.]
MELLYAYIEKFKNIERQEFNFSPRCYIHYDREKNTLSVTASQDYIPNLFGSGISNVTAIIGKNGSGKSNLLECLLEHIVGTKHSWESNIILVFLKGENEIACKTNLQELAIIVPPPVKATQIEPHREYSLRTSEGSCLYYSYLYDGELRRFQFEQHIRVLDLSTNRRVAFSESYRKSFEDQEIQSQLTFRTLEMRTLVKFLFRIGTDLLNIRIPDIIQISISVPFSVELVKNVFKSKNGLSQELSDDLDLIAERLPGRSTYSYFRAGLFFGLLYDQAAQIVLDRFVSFVIDIADHIRENDDIEDDILFDIPYKLHYEERISKVLQCIKELEPFVHNSRAFRVPVKDALLVIKLLDMIGLLNFRLGDPFDFDVYFDDEENPGGLSGGERSFLGLLSRFHLATDASLSGNYFVLLDEADIGFHPQWQKHLLKYLCEYLPIVLHSFDRSPIQIFITAHSPFIASDLPKENILFLNKDSEGKCQIDPGVNHEQTFAANIHTLLSDSFFLKDGLIGDLAEQRIEELIEAIQKFPETEQLAWLQGEKEEQKRTIRALIGKVGEPIIRDKLYQLYEEHIGESREERRARLRRELEELDREEDNE